MSAWLHSLSTPQVIFGIVVVALVSLGIAWIFGAFERNE